MALHSASLQFFNVTPGQTVSVSIANSPEVSWSLGPGLADTGGFLLSVASGVLPLSSLSLDAQTMVFVIAAGEGGAVSLVFALQLYIACADHIAECYLRCDSDSGVSATVAIDSGRMKPLGNGVNIPFAL